MAADGRARSLTLPPAASPGARSERRPLSERLQEVVQIQNGLIAVDFELELVLGAVAEHARSLTLADGAAVEMVDGSELICRAAAGTLASYRGMRIPRSGSLTGLCLQSGEVLICHDAREDERAHREACERPGFRSLLVVPLRYGSDVVGVLKVASSDVSVFDDDDVATLQLMSGLVAAAIARASDDRARAELLEEQRAALARLSEREALLRALFESSPFPIAVVRREEGGLRYLSVNPATERLLGAAAGSLVGRLSVELGTAPEALTAATTAISEAERTGQPVFWEYTQGQDERRLHLSCTVVPLPPTLGGHSRRFCLIAQDVTERVTLRQRVELNDRMASVGRLAAGVAHEANNPLAYVISNLSFLSDGLREVSALIPEAVRLELEQSLSEAQEGAKRVKLIIKDLYTFVRSDSEVMEPVDLAVVAERAIAMSGHAVYPRAQVERAFHPHPPVTGLSARLGQVLINLLVNAAQAMPSERDRGQNRIRVSIGVWRDGRAVVEVADNGAGMAPEVVRKVFEPFYTTKPQGGGMGLGLSLCHNIVQAHRGELTVESSLGEGTIFRILLPSA